MGDIAGLFLIIVFVFLFRLRRRVKLLEARLAALEAPGGGVVPQTAQMPASPSPASPAGLSVFAPRTEAPTSAEPPVYTPETYVAPPDPVAPAASAAAGSADATEPPSRGLAGFEERFGALWAVWLGGIALALGGVFLVRYAIEADLIGPGARLSAGALLALGLVAAGEGLRRKARGSLARPALPFADVPAMLTAAGTSTAYAVVYAAYELYALLPPAPAFLLLGLVAVGSMLAALLHGPALAALGLVAAGVAPLLVSTSEPSAWGLAVYVAVVAGAAFAVARARLWSWLAALASVGVLLWGLVLLVLGADQVYAPVAFLAAALMGLTLYLLVPGLFRGPPAGEAPRPDWVSGLAIGVALALSALLTIASGQSALAVAVFAALAVSALAIAWRAEAGVHAPLMVALAAPLVLAGWDVLATGGTTLAPPGHLEGVVSGPEPLALGGFAAFGLGFAALLGLSGYRGARRAQRLVPALAWSAAAVVGPLLLMFAAYWRLTGFGLSWPFALMALLLAALATVAADRLSFAGSAVRFAATVFAAGAAAALALALTMALERGWLTVGLALASLGLAWVSTLRPLPGLRQLAAVMGLSVLGRAMWDPSIAGGDPGPNLVLNWLLWGYGVPAAAFALAAWRLGGQDWARRSFESLALLFGVLLAVTQIRHAATGTLVGAPPGLVETGGYLAVALAYAVGLERMRRASTSPVYEIASLLALAAAAMMTLAVLWPKNPLLTGDPVGGLFVNLLLLAYGLPALLAFALNRLSAGQRPDWHRRASGALALVLAFAYVTLNVRRFFVGERLDAFALGNTELYAYSIAWLAFGIALLLGGLLTRSRELRLASALVVALTVAKVFLWDMADLEGVLRALSFIGLGLVLVAIGWLYQHLLLRPGPARERA